MNKNSIYTLITCATVVLAGCDGGGGSAPEARSQVTLSGAVATSIAADAYDTSAFDASEGAGDFLPLSASTESKIGQKQIAELLKSAIMQDGASTRAVTKATQTVDLSAYCSSGGGSMSITAPDNAQSLPITVSYSASFSSCDDGYGTSMNGGISGSMTIDASYNTTMSMNYSNFSVSDGTVTYTYDGGMDLSDSYDSTTYASTTSLTTDYFKVSDGTNYSAMYDAAFVSIVDSSYVTSETIDGTFDNSVYDGSYTIDTTTAFKSDYSYPYEGVMVITGASNSKIRITALSTTDVKIEWDADGDDTYEGSETTTWSALES